MDPDTALLFPAEVAVTSLRPDIVVWSQGTKTVILCEFTFPWEDHSEEAYERKKEKCQDLIGICKERGYQPYCYQVEIGCREFIAHSTMKFLKDMGIFGKQRLTVCKRLKEASEIRSSWILSSRKK